MYVPQDVCICHKSAKCVRVFQPPFERGPQLGLLRLIPRRHREPVPEGVPIVTLRLRHVRRPGLFCNICREITATGQSYSVCSQPDSFHMEFGVS